MADDETKQVEVLFGPYAGSILTMSAADAEAATAQKWAIEPPRTPPIDPDAQPLPDLTTEEREAAEAKAAEWAAGIASGEPITPDAPIDPP